MADKLFCMECASHFESDFRECPDCGSTTGKVTGLSPFALQEGGVLKSGYDLFGAPPAHARSTSRQTRHR